MKGRNSMQFKDVNQLNQFSFQLLATRGRKRNLSRQNGLGYQGTQAPIPQADTTIKFRNTQNDLLGKGVYGIVYKRSYQGQLVAVKRIQLVELDDLQNDRETNAMENLDHQNVLKLISKQIDDDFLYLIMELCQGTIEDYVYGQLKIEIAQLMPPEPNALHDMASGLQYIHKQSLVHRDIKPANVLISTSSASGRAVLKISDFGLTRPVSERSKNFTVKTGVKGTPLYLAPEYRQLLSKSDEEREKIRANVSIDIFSLGCLFYTYITRKHPFAMPEPPNPDDNQTVINITSGNKYLVENGLNTSHYAYQIIEGMIQPNQRLGLEQVIQVLEFNRR